MEQSQGPLCFETFRLRSWVMSSVPQRFEIITAISETFLLESPVTVFKHVFRFSRRRLTMDPIEATFCCQILLPKGCLLPGFLGFFRVEERVALQNGSSDRHETGFSHIYHRSCLLYILLAPSLHAKSEQFCFFCFGHP